MIPMVGDTLYVSLKSTDGAVSRFSFASGSGFSEYIEPNTYYLETVFDPSTSYIGQTIFKSASSGVLTQIPPADLHPDPDPTLADGLTATAADALGVNPNVADNFVKGISDLVVLQSGLLGSSILATQTGVVSSVPLQGEAVAVTLTGATSNTGSLTAYVATGDYGLAIVDESNSRSPKILGQIQLSGTATNVGVDTTLQLAAVATGAGGLEIINVADATVPKLIQSAPIDATSVQVFEGVAYANDGGMLDAVDLTTGEVLQKLNLTGSQITGLARDGSKLYVMDASDTLSVIDLSGGLMVKNGSVALPYGGGRLFVGNGVAYVAAGAGITGGYATVDVSNPSAPKLIEGPDATNIGGAAIALNGSGLGVLVGSPGAANAVDVVNASDPTKTGQFITRYTLPSTPTDVAIADGVAFVADGASGLQVINYRSFDTQGVAPAVTITRGPTDANPGTPGIQVTEGSTVNLQAGISDDVQVRDVAVLVNGQVISDSVSFPWDLSAQLPTIAANGSNQTTIQIRATDTGGNTTTTNAINVQLVPDTTPPQIINQSIVEGEVVGKSLRSITLTFSEPLDPSTVTAASFTLVGPAGAVQPTAVQLRANDQIVQVTYPALAVGQYQLEVDGAAITDRAGNPLSALPLITDFTVQPFSVEWINANGGDWNTAANWSTSAIPGAEDDVLADVQNGVTVTVRTGAQGIARLVKAGAGTLALSAKLAASGEISLAGALSIASGGSLSGSAVQGDLATLTQSGGSLSGAGTLNVTGLMSLSGGVETGSGTTIAQGGASITGGFGLDGGRTLRLQGASAALGSYVSLDLNSANPQTGVSDAGAGTLTIANGATFNDQTAGYLNISVRATRAQQQATTGASAAVNNAGTWTKSGSASRSTISAVFNNTGTVDVESGVLTLSGGGTDVGATYKGAGTVEFSGGALTLDASSTIAGNASFSGGHTTVNGGVGSGLLSITGGEATFKGAVTAGALDQSGGELDGSGTVTATGLSGRSPAAAAWSRRVLRGRRWRQGGMNPRAPPSTPLPLSAWTGGSDLAAPGREQGARLLCLS